MCVKRRPSVEAIYETLTNEYVDIDDEEFCEVFKQLEKSNIIKNIKPKEDMGSYRLNEETFVKIYNTQQEYKIIQNQLIEVINVLRDQLLSINHEINQQNETIQKLKISLNKKSTNEVENTIATVAVDTQVKSSNHKKKDDQICQDEKDSKIKCIEFERSLTNQLTKIRQDKLKAYLLEKEKEIQIQPGNDTKLKDSDYVHQWKPNTVLIAGDSTLNGIMEKRMGQNIKVRAFPGARVNDMFSYLIPLLKKNPKYVILHVGTNDTVNNSTEEILNKILQLKNYVEKALPESVVIISHPTIRIDDIKANNILTKLRENLEVLNIKCILHNNITKEFLSRGGLHLSAKGCGRFAMNFISYIRHL